MALSEVVKDMSIIAKLDDEPNDVGGLSAAQLKAKFDEGGEALKEYINEVLLPELAAHTAAQSLGAVINGEAVTIQGALDLLQQATVQNGNVPTGGEAGQYLRKKSDGLYDLEWAPFRQFARFEFSAKDWTENSSGEFEITVPKDVHKRASAQFGCYLRHNVDGVLKANTWAVFGTQSRYNETDSSITLSCAEAYAGTALFFDEGTD